MSAQQVQRGAPWALLGLAVWLVSGASGGLVWAQSEVDRATPDPDRRRSVVPGPSRSGAAVAPVTSPTRPPAELLPQELRPEDLEGFPTPLDTRLPEREKPPTIELRHSGKLRLSGGHDTNVFRADRNRRSDGFLRGGAEAEVLAKIAGGSEVFVEVSGETLLYRRNSKANEHFVSAFVEYYQPLPGGWLDAGVQSAFEFSRLNLLNDNGDLFPRGRFGSIDEEVRLFAILRPQVEDRGGLVWRDLALEWGASFRLKNYEENSGVDSLDYEEVRLDTSISYKLSRTPRSRLKLKYRFRRRDYDEFRARERSGTIGAASPVLDLHRHQLNLTWFQDYDLSGPRDAGQLGFSGRLIMGLGGVYNRDLYRNDRSYREVSLSLRWEWWLHKDDTRISFSSRAVARNFLVRQPANKGGHLRHRLLRLRFGVWRKLHEVAREEAGADPWLTVAAFASTTVIVWRSKDPLEDYDRYVLEAGVEVSW